MADSGIGTISQGLRGRRIPFRLVFSYLFDWIVCIVFVGIGGVLDRVAPAKRPFSLVDPSISYPFEEHELVPAYLLFVLAIGVPVVIVAVVSLIFVPGPTVPKGTPKSLIWQRKLWELHVGLLGLVLSLSLSWFFTSSMKNLFGKPRPDLLARCEPDWDNLKKYIVGGKEEQGSVPGNDGGHDAVRLAKGLSIVLVSAGSCESFKELGERSAHGLGFAQSQLMSARPDQGAQLLDTCAAFG
ncbi:hypothetical protein FDECE_18622, partial [Fusarium decemcellulare]